MSDIIALRYRELGVAVPVADITMALEDFKARPSERAAKVAEVEEYCARRYRLALNKKLSRKNMMLFAMAVAVLFANEVHAGRENIGD